MKLSNLIAFLKSEPCKLEPFQRKGLENLTDCLESFLQNLEQSNSYHLEAFTSTTVESTDIIHASPSFYGAPFCSNVVVSDADKLAWYALVSNWSNNVAFENEQLLTNLYNRYYYYLNCQRSVQE